MTVVKSRTMAALFVATGLVALLGAVQRFDSLPEGLHGIYFSTPDWSSAPVHSTVDPQPSTERLVAAWDGTPPPSFSTTWTGFVITLREGTYTLALASDDGSWAFVDGQLVVDNGGRHGVRQAVGSIHLTRGVHGIFIRYFQAGGLLRFDASWARDGAPLEPLPAWALTPRRPTFSRFLASVVVRRALPVAEWLWIAALVVAGATAAWRLAAKRLAARRWDSTSRALAAVCVASLALNLTGLRWGLPGQSWAPDEITPGVVLNGLALHFSNGWYDPYPPVHFYVLAGAFSPVLLLERLGRVDLSGAFGYDLLMVIARLVTVAAGVGTVIAVYACGARAFSRRAGVLAAAAVALVAPFIYYSKTVNFDVPYLFWFALSLSFYLGLLQRLQRRDFVLFAACATLAVCTKDQAYGLYLAAPFVIVAEIWRANRQAGLSRPLGRAIVDRRLALAAATAAALFVVIHNLAFNFGGFLSHLHWMTRSGAQGYRVVEPTIAGRLQLLQLTAWLDQRSWGWPLLLASVIGLVMALASRETRRTAGWLALVPIAYYLGFVNVILYNYDRFLLPVCIVQALFAGVALDRLLAASDRTRAWRAAAVGGVFAYTLLYASTVDVLMVRDSRYTVERWLRGHVGRDDVVGTVFPRWNLPRLEEFRAVDIGTIDELLRQAPAFYVLNADYARAVPPDTSTGQLVAGLQDSTLGYVLSFRYRSPAPWPWLPGAHRDLVGARRDRLVFSTLRDINPTIEIYQRATAPDRHMLHTF